MFGRRWILGTEGKWLEHERSNTGTSYTDRCITVLFAVIMRKQRVQSRRERSKDVLTVYIIVLAAISYCKWRQYFTQSSRTYDSSTHLDVRYMCHSHCGCRHFSCSHCSQKFWKVFILTLCRKEVLQPPYHLVSLRNVLKWWSINAQSMEKSCLGNVFHL